MNRQRNRRLHNAELKMMIAYHEQEAGKAALRIADLPFWAWRIRRAERIEASKHQAIADALRKAMTGGRTE